MSNHVISHTPNTERRKLTYYMDDSKFEQLVRDNPDLFEKSDEEYFGVGNGWYNVLRILCGFISHDVNQARRRLQFALDNPDNKFAESIPELEKKLEQAIEELPTIEQVKEKFGTLRFYVAGGNASVHSYIEFAEAMTSITCEECGAPGESRNDGWVKVLCDKHHKERNVEYNRITTSFSKIAPKLSDE